MVAAYMGIGVLGHCCIGNKVEVLCWTCDELTVTGVFLSVVFKFYFLVASEYLSLLSLYTLSITNSPLY